MNRKFSFSIQEFYHLYNRGNEKRTIFLEQKDYQRFTRLLFLCNNVNAVSVKDTMEIPLTRIDRGDTLVDIGAYCLMPNHFHLLVREKREGGISLFVKKLATGYSMYFNKKNDRIGKLLAT
ncbi:MAG: transposase [Candidatus Yonathbacteria bacterium]|nr:transposase [Candidatus Yonathbacteria bacterium]